MTKNYVIQYDEAGDIFELICAPGYGIDSQHYFYEDTRVELMAIAKDIRPCDCADCSRQLSESITL